MAVKTITIDMEAYTVLSELKKGTESFSQVIKRILAEESKTAERLLENIDSLLLSDSALENVERIIRDRENSLIGSPVLQGE